MKIKLSTLWAIYAISSFLFALGAIWFHRFGEALAWGSACISDIGMFYHSKKDEA